LGQKVHPIGLRLGIIRSWDSTWFAKKEYANLVYEDAEIRRFLKEKLYHAGISRIEIARAADRARIRIHTARPGIVIGKKGSEIEALKQQLEQIVRREVMIDIQEVRKPEMDATLVAENIALQLTRRVAFRRAMKKAVSSSLKFGAKGVRVACAGRLGGAEMARPDVSGIAKVGCRCTRLELILIMALRWPRPRTG
jgi:small subunit ribosomal protein S3